MPEATPMSTMPAEDAWREIENLVHEVARLSKSDLPAPEFHSALVGHAFRALGAAAAALWTRAAEGGLRIEYQMNRSSVQVPAGELDGDLAGEAEQAAYSLRLAEALSEGAARVIPARAARGAESPLNPTEFLLIAGPVMVDGQAIAILEVFLRPGASPSTQQGYADFVTALCELAGDFHRQRQLLELRQKASLWGQFEQFSERAHAGLDLDATAYVIANEGRALIGCDRVSVLVKEQTRFRVVAVSGVDTLDPRANSLRALELLASACAASGREALWFSGSESPELPGNLQVALQNYLEISHARQVAVQPVPSRPHEGQESKGVRLPMAAALVIEQFESHTPVDSFREKVEAVTRMGGSALRNAIEHRSLPLFPVLRAVQEAAWYTRAKAWPRTRVVLALAAVAVLALVIIPARLEVTGRGELQPKFRHDVFAASDGVVDEVLARHGERVAKGQVLARLRNSDLEFELSRVSGEMQTARKRLASVQAARLGKTPETADSRSEYHQLTAEEEELKELLRGLGGQNKVLLARQESLTIRSPAEGQVLTWSVEELLAARPVQRGQVLMTVAEIDGPWILELEVPDSQIGHVLAAQSQLGAELPVSYLVATNPGATLEGHVEKVALATEESETEGATVLVTVAIDRNQVALLRPGATVIPKISCGRRALGYVWFHELFEIIQSRLLF